MVKKIMQVILLKDVPKLGSQGQLKNVSDGYALNFLLPKKLAIKASADKIEGLKSQEAKAKQAQQAAGQKQAELLNKLRGIKLEIAAKASVSGKLFAGLSPKDISNELKKQKKLEVEEKYIKLRKHIKKTGEHKININLGDKMGAEIAVVVRGEK